MICQGDGFQAWSPCRNCVLGEIERKVRGRRRAAAIAHVLLGEGVRLFDHLGSKVIHLEHIRTLETPGATHLSFRVVK